MEDGLRAAERAVNCALFWLVSTVLLISTHGQAQTCARGTGCFRAVPTLLQEPTTNKMTGNTIVVIILPTCVPTGAQ